MSCSAAVERPETLLIATPLLRRRCGCFAVGFGAQARTPRCHIGLKRRAEPPAGRDPSPAGAVACCIDLSFLLIAVFLLECFFFLCFSCCLVKPWCMHRRKCSLRLKFILKYMYNDIIDILDSAVLPQRCSGSGGSPSLFNNSNQPRWGGLGLNHALPAERSRRPTAAFCVALLSFALRRLPACSPSLFLSSSFLRSVRSLCYY